MKQVLISLFVFAIMLISAHAVIAHHLALTMPPPDDDRSPTLYSIFDPNYNYLINGGTSLSPSGGAGVNIFGYSTASQQVNSIGIQITLQQWTGSDWINVFSSPSASESSSFYIERDYEVTVTKGYYYRTMSYHWTDHEGREDGHIYSGSILIPN